MTFKCTIHNVTFSAEGLPAAFPHECPVCMREEVNRTRAAFEHARDERNALLRAIEIKRDALLTLQP